MLLLSATLVSSIDSSVIFAGFLGILIFPPNAKYNVLPAISRITTDKIRFIVNPAFAKLFLFSFLSFFLTAKKINPTTGIADIKEYMYQSFFGTACLFSDRSSATICASCFSSFSLNVSGIISGVRLSVTPSVASAFLASVTVESVVS